jgi:hypothetical protein
MSCGQNFGARLVAILRDAVLDLGARDDRLPAAANVLRSKQRYSDLRCRLEPFVRAGGSRCRAVLWIVSEVCYYLGLVLAALLIPAVALIMWLMSLVDKAEPNFGHFLIAWALSAMMFLIGIGLKRWVVRGPIR